MELDFGLAASAARGCRGPPRAAGGAGGRGQPLAAPAALGGPPAVPRRPRRPHGRPPEAPGVPGAAGGPRWPLYTGPPLRCCNAVAGAPPEPSAATARFCSWLFFVRKCLQITMDRPQKIRRKNTPRVDAHVFRRATSPKIRREIRRGSPNKYAREYAEKYAENTPEISRKIRRKNTPHIFQNIGNPVMVVHSGGCGANRSMCPVWLSADASNAWSPENTPKIPTHTPDFY